MPEASTVTVGTFDGVHLGHQKMIAELLRRANERKERSVLVTFDPHPLYVVRPEHAPRLISTRAEREELLGSFGIDEVVFIPFTHELSQFEPERFVREVLIEQFGLSHLVIGYDHGFGRGRSGDVDTLREIGRKLNFGVEVIEPHKDGGENVSSSHIRAQLQAGDVVSAARGLGRPYSLSGVVVHGDGRGREMGMPTANLQIPEPEKLVPFEGIYAVRIGESGGVMHIGPRPTIKDAKPSLEVHLFDRNEDLYGNTLKVEFVDRIRGVQKFESIDVLAKQMQADAIAARGVLRRESAG